MQAIAILVWALIAVVVILAGVSAYNGMRATRRAKSRSGSAGAEKGRAAAPAMR